MTMKTKFRSFTIHGFYDRDWSDAKKKKKRNWVDLKRFAIEKKERLRISDRVYVRILVL